MKTFQILLFILVQTCSFGQTDLKQLLDSVISRTKLTSMYSSIVNWDSLEKEVYAKAITAKNLEDLKPAFTTLLNGLKDHHGRILNAENYSTLANFTDYKNLNHPDQRPRSTEIWKIVNDSSMHFEARLLKGNIGYLKIVGIPPNANLEQEARKIRNEVLKLSKLKVNKWIIDLRYNGGGNMHPMVEGVAPLIGEGKVGSTVDIKGNKQFDWEIKNSNFIYFNYQLLDLPNKPTYAHPPKLAVLISRYTVSSGELLATCFKGRPNTRFFGEASGALTSNNNWEIVNNKVILNISTGVFCDRNGINYRYNIPVDVDVPFEIEKDIESQTAIQEVKKWLSE